MLHIQFSELRGNNAPKYTARDTKAAEAAKALAAPVFEKLLQLDLSSDEREALEFIKTANASLVYQFAQCKDSEAAKAKYSHFCDFGDKRFYSVTTAPVNLFDLLSNLATGYRLYKAAKIVAKQADKPKTLQAFVADKRLPAGVFEAARDLFVSQYIDYLYSLQLTRGVVLVNLKASEFTEAEAEALVTAREAAEAKAKQAEAEAKQAEATEASEAEAAPVEAEATEASEATEAVQLAREALAAAEAKAAEAAKQAAATGKPSDKAKATKAAKAVEAAKAKLAEAEAANA